MEVRGASSDHVERECQLPHVVKDDDGVGEMLRPPEVFVGMVPGPPVSGIGREREGGDDATVVLGENDVLRGRAIDVVAQREANGSEVDEVHTVHDRSDELEDVGKERWVQGGLGPSGRTENGVRPNMLHAVSRAEPSRS